MGLRSMLTPRLSDLPEKAARLPGGGWRVALGTRRRYINAIRHLQKWLDKNGLRVTRAGELTVGMIEDYARYCERDAGLAPASANGYKRDLKTVFRQNGYPELGEVLHQRKEPYKNRATREDDFCRVLTLARTRDAAMLLFLRYTGCRRQTVTTLRWDALRLWEVDGVGRLAARIVEKGEKERYVFTAEPRTVMCLQMWRQIQSARTVDYVFTNAHTLEPLSLNAINTIFRQLREAARLSPDANFSPHTLRHSYAQEMLTKHDAAIVADLMGHESPETTLAVYGRRSVDDLAAAVFGDGALPPGF